VAESAALKRESNNVCARAQKIAGREPDRLFCRLLKGGTAQDITYGELIAANRRCAAVYLDRGVAEGDVVLIILRHGPKLYPAFFGAMLIGALTSFLPFLTPRQESDLYWATHRAAFARTEARLLVTWGDNLESRRQALPDLSLPVHLVEDTARDSEVTLPARDLMASEPRRIAIP
jgi:acyl-CoA synthetase (AMP-forming)/AMP-acid ligase II